MLCLSKSPDGDQFVFAQRSLLCPSFWISGEKTLSLNVELAFSSHFFLKLWEELQQSKQCLEMQTAAARGQSSKGCRLLFKQL